MRKAFVKSLCQLASMDKRIFLLTGDLGFNILEPFIDKFPDRFLNVGVAEANLITVAAGLASSGFIPFAYSIATFASMRPFEQIRNDVGYQQLPVKIIGVGGGLAYTKAGPTHHSIEDIALMRLIPNMIIISPSDSEEAFEATSQIAGFPGPVYMRFERNPVIKGSFKKPRFILGKGQRINAGEKLAIITTGAQLHTAMRVLNILNKHNLNPAIYSFPTIKPLDKNLLSKIRQEYSLLVTIEEHKIHGGLGSAIADYYIDNFHEIPFMLRFGINMELDSISADYESLMRYYILKPEQIAKKILQIIK